MAGDVLALVCLAVLLGAFAQRSTGMGFALVAAPFLVLLLGPLEGVVLVNLASVLSAGLVLLRVRRDIEWRTYLWLIVPALVGIVPGSLLAVLLDPDWLEFSIGLVLIVALSGSILLRRVAVTLQGRVPPVVAGFTSGLTNAAAGIGGPPVGVYAVVSGWSQRAFAATVQPYFLSIGLVSVVTKLALEPSRWPQLDWWMWVVLALALVFGIVGGELVAGRLHPKLARRAVFAVALVGSAVVAASGLSALIAAGGA